MRPFWLKFGLKEFEEWIFRDVVKWIVAPFHGNLPNSNDPRILYYGKALELRNYLTLYLRSTRLSMRFAYAIMRSSSGIFDGSETGVACVSLQYKSLCVKSGQTRTGAMVKMFF